MWYRSPPRPPPGHSMAASATPAHMAAAAGPAEPAGADLEAGLLGWLFGCRRCAAVDELRAGCEQRYATKRCLQLHYLVNASSTGPRSGTLRCGAASERGPAKIRRWRVGLRAADAKSLGALTAQAAYRAVLTFQGSIWARTGRLG